MNKLGKSITILKWPMALAAIALLNNCGKKNKNTALADSTTKAPTRVEVIEVKSAVTDTSLSYSGTVTPMVTTPLSFLLPGTVVSIKVDEGDKVKKGQLLAELNDISYKNAYLATLASEKQAQDAYNRLKTVHDKGSLPEIQWEDVKAKLAQAKSANEIALQNVSNSKLIAPSGGIIGARNIEIGITSIPGNPVFNLVSLNEVYVKVSVPENEINKIKNGQLSSIIIPALGSTVYTGKVEKIGVVASPISKTYEVKIRIPNPKLNIKPGMACDVTIELQASHAAISVPYQSVVKDKNGETFVYAIAHKSKTAMKQSVKLGSFTNNNIEVLSGLSAGDLVVSSGQQKLTDKAEVIF